MLKVNSKACEIDSRGVSRKWGGGGREGGYIARGRGRAWMRTGGKADQKTGGDVGVEADRMRQAQARA